MTRIASSFAFLAVLVSVPIATGQTPDAAKPASRPANWLREGGSQPAEPFRVIGNVYYVGAVGVSSYIISTSDGLILLDTGTEQMFAGILANIEKLAFRWQDIKIILSSHAHWDHVEGHARMKEKTGARVVASGQDARAIATGVDHSALGGTGWQATPVDRVLSDGDTVRLGDVTMYAHLTAGHTKGCTTWTMTVQEGPNAHLVVFVGGTSINPGVKLLSNPRHPEIAEDYARTFRTLKEIRADVFLAQHPDMYGMVDKYRRMKAGAEQNPFIDAEQYQQFVRQEEAKYVAQLQEESAAQ